MVLWLVSTSTCTNSCGRTVQGVRAWFPFTLQFVLFSSQPKNGGATGTEKPRESCNTCKTTTTNRPAQSQLNPTTHFLRCRTTLNALQIPLFPCHAMLSLLFFLFSFYPKKAEQKSPYSQLWLQFTFSATYEKQLGLKRIPSMITFCMHFLAIPNSHII